MNIFGPQKSGIVVSLITTYFFFAICSISTWTQTRESKSSGQIYSSTGAADTLNRSGIVVQQLKLIDDKNYELTSKVLTPSLNGGDQIDREVTEKSRQLNAGQSRVERLVRVPDANGRLYTQTITNEDHTSKDKKEEIQRSHFQADINGKMVIQSVENETHAQITPQEKEITRALYRPGMDGKLVLSELEEGTERKLTDRLTVKENSRKTKDSNGQMILVGTTKEMTTRINDKIFKKETILQQAGENGRLVLTDKIMESQTENPDGTRKYQRILESRNITPQQRSLNSGALILAQRVTGEERRLPDGSIESQTQVETLDPVNLANGLRVTEITSEVSKPLGNGKVNVERVVKIRDVNGNFTVAQKVSQTIQAAK